MTGSTSRSKVARLIDERGLDGIGSELEERWTRAEDRDGLRPLAAYFNRELLHASLDTDGAEPLDGEVENTYRLLTDDEVSSGVRTQVRARLERNGVDVDRLEREFVSRQAIHTYLTDYRGVDPPEEPTTPAEQRTRKRETIERLRSRLVAVAERALAGLRDADRLTLGEFTVLVTVRVHCADCDTQATVTDLLADGGCRCDSSDD